MAVDPTSASPPTSIRLSLVHTELRLPDRRVPVSLAATERGLVAIRLDHAPADALASIRRELAEPGLRVERRDVDPVLRAFLEELHAYGRSGRTSWRVPFELLPGTSFQREVWRSIAKIPPGETRTYGELARAIGRPGAARAVGGACGRNPLPLRIPCHRVVSGAGLGGFTGVLATKRALLRHEGALGGAAAEPSLFPAPPERDSGGGG